MHPVILFRNSIELGDEIDVARGLMPLETLRSKVPSGSLVFGRYSVLPFYRELERDLENQGSRLINSHSQHLWIANFDYYDTFREHTFETWFDLRDIPDCPLVVKGRTNSRKARWNTQMFAKDRRQAIEIATELMMDPLLQGQGIIVRRYEELELLETGLNGQPFVNEHRLFYYGCERLVHGFYWMQSEATAEIDQEGLDFADQLAFEAAKHANFFVLDVAKNAEGKWRLVEINDAQMSGLSRCDAYELYTKLACLTGAVL